MGLGPVHLMILLVIVLLFFGPQRLPNLAKALGESIRGFKKAMNGEEDAATRDVTHTAKNEQLHEGDKAKVEAPAHKEKEQV